MPKLIIDLNATKEDAINELNDFIDNRLHSDDCPHQDHSYANFHKSVIYYQ